MPVYLAIIKKRGLDTLTALLLFILPISHFSSTAKSGESCDHLPFIIG